MAFSKGRLSSLSLEEILSRVSEADILAYYLGITEVPTIINSPLREDRRPSFGIYSNDGKKISYKDFSTRDSGGLFDLLGKMWGMGYLDVLSKISNDIPKFGKSANVSAHNSSSCIINKVGTINSELQCKIRECKDYDIAYWNSYGITLDWLKYAEVYPISHKIIIKGTKRYVLGADKYAYAYVERKEGKITLKIYQPFNKNGYKWANKHDTSVISLWTKVPENGDKLCICASLKDALCLWSNTGIPCIATQGEGYRMSDTAISELKRRYNKVYILFDNDEAGLIDGKKLAEDTGFINLVLPTFEGGKDVSDFYRTLNDKDKFKQSILKLFDNEN